MAAKGNTNQKISASFQHPEIPIPDFECVGVGAIILNPDGSKYFLLRGDRHHLPKGIKKAWEAIFHAVLKDPDGKAVIKGAPFQVFTVKETLYFLGQEYSASDQASAIVEYCVTKGWFPKCCFTEMAAIEIAMSGEDYAYTVNSDQLEAFFSELTKFTALVAEYRYLENVFGGIQGGPTFSPDEIWACLMDESEEESGMRFTNAQFLCYSAPRTSRKTGKISVTAFFVAWVGEDEMTAAFAAKMLRDRPFGNEWACALPFYKTMDVDQAAAKASKANLETLPESKWFEFDSDGHPLMDDKNKTLIQTYVRDWWRMQQGPNPGASSRRLNEPEAKRQRENPEEEPEEPEEPKESKESKEPEESEPKSNKWILHHMANDGKSVTPLLPQPGDPPLPSHSVPIGANGFYIGEPAVVVQDDLSLPSQYWPVPECVITVLWQGGRVRIPKTAFRDAHDKMWVQ